MSGLVRSYQQDSTIGYRDWRYRYSASGEREQKRLVDWQAGGIVTHPDTAKLAWVYYALGGNGQQLAVHHGQELVKPLCGDSGRRVYMYPTEYLTYGVGTSMNVTTDANGVKSYKIGDHLGSTRVMVRGTSVSERSDYEPFGKREVVAGVGGRKGYIDREEDVETGMGNFGVRQMKERFWSPDPKWEKYRSLSPYVYGENNPIVKSDRLGEESVGGNAVSGGIGGHNEMNPQDYYDLTAPEEGGGLTGIGGTAGRISAGEAWSQFWGRILGEPTARSGTEPAGNAANGVRLNKSLASNSQMSGKGITMAGSSGRVPFRDAGRIAQQYGGNSADWVKKTSPSYTASDGTKFETHWVENVKTGQRVEFKTKFPGGN